MKMAATIVLFLIVYVILSISGLTVATWQCWAILTCLMLIDIVAFMRGMDKS